MVQIYLYFVLRAHSPLGSFHGVSKDQSVETRDHICHYSPKDIFSVIYLAL